MPSKPKHDEDHQNVNIASGNANVGQQVGRVNIASGNARVGQQVGRIGRVVTTNNTDDD